MKNVVLVLAALTVMVSLAGCPSNNAASAGTSSTTSTTK